MNPVLCCFLLWLTVSSGRVLSIEGSSRRLVARPAGSRFSLLNEPSVRRTDRNLEPLVPDSLETERSKKRLEKETNTTSSKANKANKTDTNNSTTSPPDPCIGKTTCEECQEAAQGLIKSKVETCSWKKPNCTKVPASDHDDVENMCPKPPSPKSDPCQEAKTCKQCQNVTSSKNETCHWEADVCKRAENGVPPPADMCGGDKEDGKGGDAQEKEKGGSRTMVFVLIVILGFIYYLLRKRRSTVGSRFGEISGGPTRFHKSSLYEGISTHEQDDVDDWDWEDDGGDVELGGTQKISPAKARSGGRYQDEILPNAYVQEDSRLVRRTSSNDGMDVPGLSVQNVSKATARTSPQFHSKKGAALPSMPPQRITKLGSPVNLPQKKPQQASPKQDDIFAEMGLSVKPNFSQNAASRPATTSHTLGATHLPPDGDDTKDGTDWGDDSDLDDLLND